MHNVSQLEKQQVGLRLYKYLIDDIDQLTKEFAVNRSDIITEAIKSYIDIQKERIFYASFEKSYNEAKQMIEGKIPESTLEDLINELNNNTDS